MHLETAKVLVTLGPATREESALKALKDRGVNFARVNMSHSSLDDLRYFIQLTKDVGVALIIDTEGPQIRVGYPSAAKVYLNENEKLKLFKPEFCGDDHEISLKPGVVVDQLEEGDILYIDFGTLVARVSDVSTASRGFITIAIITGGTLNGNRAVSIDPVIQKKFHFPSLSSKDHQAIKLGLQEGVGYIAASFIRSGAAVDEIRNLTGNSVKIISKVECWDAINDLDEIIEKSDALLIDRGDLGKEISRDRVPTAQKLILQKAREKNKAVFVSSNLLDTMIEKKEPAAAEVAGVASAISEGVAGVMLSAETAIGKYPVETVNVVNSLFSQYSPKAAPVFLEDQPKDWRSFLVAAEQTSLTPPHGGKLVDRTLAKPIEKSYLNSLRRVTLNKEQQMDVEQIAFGTFSPLEGFMVRDDLSGVLDNMQLSSGAVWTVPVVLDVTESDAASITVGDSVALTDAGGIMAVLRVDDKYRFPKQELARKLYGTESLEHPGVRWVNNLKPMFLGGPVDLIRRRSGGEFREYELTPRQARKLFKERGWSKVIAFHGRNVIHQGHEFIQLNGMRSQDCDGIFIHPVTGKKKPGDFHFQYIIKSYNKMMEKFYPPNKVVFASFGTFPRYAGPREAVFTALTRKNFGCSHFIVGRDHTGVGNFYEPDASHNIFNRFPDIGIKIVKFNNIVHSKKLKIHIHETDHPDHGADDKQWISGTKAREIFRAGETPPGWFMRPEISKIVRDALDRGEEVFVPEESE